jgi:hypothetical protein
MKVVWGEHGLVVSYAQLCSLSRLCSLLQELLEKTWRESSSYESLLSIGYGEESVYQRSAQAWYVFKRRQCEITVIVERNMLIVLLKFAMQSIFRNRATCKIEYPCDQTGSLLNDHLQHEPNTH